MAKIPGERIIEKSVGTALSRMSPAAVSAGMCSLFFAVSSGLVIWVVGPTYLESQRITADAEHMRAAHENCEARLAKLEAEVAELKRHTVANN